VVRGLQEGHPLRRLDPEALQDHGQGRSYGHVPPLRSAQTLAPESWQGFSGAYRRDGQD
jgi:hypothetical protein